MVLQSQILAFCKQFKNRKHGPIRQKSSVPMLQANCHRLQAGSGKISNI